jgi:hypothetical protein
MAVRGLCGLGEELMSESARLRFEEEPTVPDLLGVSALVSSLTATLRAAPESEDELDV